MIKKYCVYKITNILSRQSYIGKTKANPKKRWNEHIKTSLSDNVKYIKSIHKAIAKYGVDNFTFEILSYYETEDLAYDAEVYYIKLFDTYNNGYNETKGGKCCSVDCKKLKNEQIINVFEDYIYNDMSSSDLSKKYKLGEGRIVGVLKRISYIDVDIPDELVYQAWLKMRCPKIDLFKISYKNRKNYKENKIKVENIFNDFVINNLSVKDISYKYQTSTQNIYYVLKRRLYKNILIADDILLEANKKLKDINKLTGKNPNNRFLDDNIIVNIFTLYSQNFSMEDISSKLDINLNYVSKILNRKIYYNVEIPELIESKVKDILKSFENIKIRRNKLYDYNFVINVLKLHCDGYSFDDIAKIQNLSINQISNVLNRKFSDDIVLLMRAENILKQKLSRKDSNKIENFKNNMFNLVEDFLCKMSYRKIIKKYNIDYRTINKLLSIKDLFDKELQDKIELEFNRRNALK